MPPQSPNSIVVQEARSKDLVPVLNGTALHSLHNPQREAEVFASNHLSHLSRSPYALILGLGFGYHIEEVAKVLRLRHKEAHIAVVEPSSELVRLHSAYAPAPQSPYHVFRCDDARELFLNDEFCRFLLKKPVVLVHQPSFDAHAAYYRNLLGRRAAAAPSAWRLGDTKLEAELAELAAPDLPGTLHTPGECGHVLRAFWEMKHAD